MSNVHGSTKGLKPSQLRQIEKLSTRKVPVDEIVSQELARQMCEISSETGRQVGVLINRKGRVEYVMVGDAKRIEMPDFGRARVSSDRLRGLRCIHTHLNGETLTQDDLTDLALLRLDVMAAVEVNRKTGLPNLVHAAHLLPGAADLDLSDHSAFEFLKPFVPSQFDIDFIELVDSLEEELARTTPASKKGKSDKVRVILVGVTTGSTSAAEESMQELEELATSADATVLDKIIQRRPQIDPRTVLGKGKLDELLIRAMRLGADLVVFDTALTPAQVRSISEATEMKVIDRPQLILDIFAQRAQSHEGKLQVELAQLKYLLPRLAQGQNSAFSRLAGGIGGRGPGETKLETDRRRVRDRISQLERQVDSIARQRHERRKRRVQKHVPIISLVGYTNAGKSTMLNALTQSSVYAERKMFATLDPTSRRLRLPHEREVVINDTVGFIRDLPEALVAAFRATLDEIADSDLLVHVVDGSNANCLQHIESVDSILNELGYSEIPSIVVINKSDLLNQKELESLERQISLDKGCAAVSVSAIQAVSLNQLVVTIGDMLSLEEIQEPQPGIEANRV